MKGIMRALNSLITVERNCHEGTRPCASNVLKILSTFAALGEYLSGAVGHCTANAGVAKCGSEVQMLVHQLARVAKSGIDLSEHCGKKQHSERAVKVGVP